MARSQADCWAQFTDPSALMRSFEVERLAWLGLGVAAITEGAFGMLGNNTFVADGAVLALGSVVSLMLIQRAFHGQGKSNPRAAGCRTWFENRNLIPVALLLAFTMVGLAVSTSYGYTIFTTQVCEVVFGSIVVVGALAAWLAEPMCCMSGQT